ncbi:MAG: winged helix-turn-helix transcriptional regulator [Opitutales bacterium]|nr:winged helix-turn-helix transcriptional regulator [Opitutales bacterium]
MAKAKMSDSDRDLLAKQLWTIGDQNRLRLLALLPHCPDTKDPISVSRLAAELNLSQPTVSNHLARLRTLGIVRHRRLGREVHYCIDQNIARTILSRLEDALKTRE